MPTFTIQPPDQSIEYTPQQVIDWLATKGITATDVKVVRKGGNPDTSPWAYEVTADQDPTTALAGATLPPSAEQQAISYIRQTFPKLNDQTQTLTQMELRQYLRALTVLVRGNQG